MRPLKYAEKGNDLSFYTYLKDCRYQVRAHFEWNYNRPELENDRNENKHWLMAKRSLEKGGRRDVFLGTRECQAYVEPCIFGEGEGFYDNISQLDYGYMYHGITYPDEAIRRGVEGIVICECVIDERGSVGQVRVVRSVDPSLDWEASRVIAQMPRWTPGRHHGKEVACRYTLPVRFDLNSTQAGKPDGKGVYTNADQMPEYPGGTSALMLFLAKTLRYPSLPEADRKIGRVVCKFVVQADGRVDNIQVVRSLGEAFDQEAVRALSKMARWKPGRNDDKPVPCYFTVPITFRY